MNPFESPAAPPWLAAEPPHQIPRVLERMLDVAGEFPQLYEELPWLRRMHVLSLIQERIDAPIFGAPSTGQEATLTSFFARVTQPIAAMVDALYTSPLLLDRRTVGEIMRRMALAAGRKPLPQAVVSGICASLVPRRRDRLGSDPIRPQHTTWQISWQQTTVWLRGPWGITNPFVVLVTDQATNTVLAVRCIPDLPRATDVMLALYDALVFSGSAGKYIVWHLAPPTQLLVQTPVPEAIRHAARVWRIEVDEIPPHDCAFLRSVEGELTQRILNLIQFLRILDRACEREFGHAPFLAKRRAVRRLGWHAQPDHDPLRTCLGLRNLLPTVPAQVGLDGTVAWQGLHYRDTEQDVLRYFPQAAVTIRPSPLSEALIIVDWQETVLCSAVADELRHTDGSYRPYWFPYPQLGE